MMTMQEIVWCGTQIARAGNLDYFSMSIERQSFTGGSGGFGYQMGDGPLGVFGLARHRGHSFVPLMARYWPGTMHALVSGALDDPRGCSHGTGGFGYGDFTPSALVRIGLVNP